MKYSSGHRHLKREAGKSCLSFSAANLIFNIRKIRNVLSIQT